MTIILSTAIPALSVEPAIRRGGYGEIVHIQGEAELTPAKLIARYAEVLPESFVAFDNKQRGDALNLDLYGYELSQDVAVVQIRHAFRRYRNGFLNLRKDYVLVGRNENGNLFRHPVEAAAVRHAICKAPEDPGAAVRGAQRWMWNVTDRQLTASMAAGMRQGDVLLVRERRPAAKDVVAERGTTVVIGGSHVIRAQRIVELRNGRVLAFAPSIWHSKGQHAPTFADHEGWYSVRAANAAPTWEWGVRLGD